MEDPRIISALFIFLKMAYYNVLINTFNVIWIFINAESYSPTVATLFVSLDISIQPRYRPVHSRIRQ